MDKLAETPEGYTDFSSLWLRFDVGDELEVVYEKTTEPMAMLLESASYQQTSKGMAFVLEGAAFQWNGVRMQKLRVTRRILDFTVGR